MMSCCLLSDPLTESTDLCSAAAAGAHMITSAKRVMFSPPLICPSAGEITPKVLNGF